MSSGRWRCAASGLLAQRARRAWDLSSAVRLGLWCSNTASSVGARGGDASRPVQGHLHSQSTKRLVAAAQLLVLGWLTLVSYSECFEKQWAWDAGREGSCPSQCSRCAWASGDVLPVVGAARIWLESRILLSSERELRPCWIGIPYTSHCSAGCGQESRREWWRPSAVGGVVGGHAPCGGRVVWRRPLRPARLQA